MATRRRARRDWRAGEPAERSPVWLLVSRLAAGFLVLAIVVAGIAFLVPEMRHRDLLDAELAALERIRDEARDTRNRTQHELTLMEHDPGYLERIARDVLDLGAAEESVLRIRRDAPRDPPASPPVEAAE